MKGESECDGFHEKSFHSYFELFRFNPFESDRKMTVTEINEARCRVGLRLRKSNERYDDPPRIDSSIDLGNTTFDLVARRESNKVLLRNSSRVRSCWLTQRLARQTLAF